MNKVMILVTIILFVSIQSVFSEIADEKRVVSRTGKCGDLLATAGPDEVCDPSQANCYIAVLWSDGTTTTELYDSIFFPVKGLGYFDIGPISTQTLPNSTSFKVLFDFKPTTITVSASNLNDFENQIINLP